MAGRLVAIAGRRFATATVQLTSAKAAAGASKGGQFNDEPPF
jgi:hypothetical protein